MIAQQKMLKDPIVIDNKPAKLPMPQPSEHGIIKNLDIEDIEFMDTGSEEESLAEAYSTTNKAMLKNRGFVEFVETHHNHHHHHHHHHQHPVLHNYMKPSNR
jgi:hypothetical protein